MSSSDAGLEHSLESLYTDHHRWLRGWLRRRVGNQELATDLVQDIFVKLLTQGERIALREPRAFLTTVAQRFLINHYRRQQLEQAWLDALAVLPEEQSLSLEEQAILLETLIEIDRLLDGLKPVVRRAFLMSQLDGMSHTAIANELGISASTVKRHIVQAARQCYFEGGD